MPRFLWAVYGTLGPCNDCIVDGLPGLFTPPSSMLDGRGKKRLVIERLRQKAKCSTLRVQRRELRVFPGPSS